MTLITTDYSEGKGLRLPDNISGTGWEGRIFSCSGRSTVGTPVFTRTRIHTYEVSAGLLKWAYYRIGGVGEATFVFPGGFYDFSTAKSAKWEIDLVYIPPTGSEQLWYRGVIESGRQLADGNTEIIAYGYCGELVNLPLVGKTYQNQTVAAIVTDLLDNYIVPERRITYSGANIEGTFQVSEVTFNSGVLRALQVLADLQGGTEWGILADRSFFFKASSRGKPQGQNVYNVGGDLASAVEAFKNASNAAAGSNIVRVVGAAALDGIPVDSYASDSTSRAAVGSRLLTVACPEIGSTLDASRLASNILTQTLNGQTYYEGIVSMADADGEPRMVEATVPVGDITLTNEANKVTAQLMRVRYELRAGSPAKLLGTIALGMARMTAADALSQSIAETQKATLTAKARPYAQDDEARTMAFFLG